MHQAVPLAGEVRTHRLSSSWLDAFRQLPNLRASSETQSLPRRKEIQNLTSPIEPPESLLGHRADIYP